MSPVAINGVDEQGVAVNGVQVLKTLDAANETVNKGVYAATTLSAVDADLAVGNIAEAVDIFGFVGTVVPGGTETIDVDTATLATGATFTPSDSGIFFTASDGAIYAPEFFSNVNTAWYIPSNVLKQAGFSAIGDGTNFRIKNNHGSLAREYYMNRHNVSTWTYERARDEDLGAGASYTPGDSGFFCWGGETTDVNADQNFPTAGWIFANPYPSADFQPGTLLIGNGSNTRFRNGGGGALVVVVMRAGLN